MIGFVDPNRYTWASLIGAMETDANLMDSYDVITLPFHLYEAPVHETELADISFSSYDFIVLGFSLLTSQLPQFLEFLHAKPDYFQQWHSKIISIVGGAHAAAHPDAMAEYGFDFIVPGEGEDVLIEFLTRLLTESIDSIKETPSEGLGVGTPYYNAAEPREVVQLGKYPPFSEKYHLFGPILLSRGCPHKCKYCQTGSQSKCMRHVPVDKVIEFLQHAVDIKYTRAWFLTPNAFAYGSKNGIKPNPEALDELLTRINGIQGLKEINFGTFPSEVRPEFVTREVLGIVMPKITNKYLVIGAQNASNRLLKVINRGHTFEDVINAIENLAEMGYSADIDFIFGLPGENEEDIQENLHFFQDVLNKKYTNVRIHTHTFMPLPGTPFEYEPLGVVDKRIQRIIGQLSTEGLAFGEFQAQAQMIETKYRKKLFS